MILFFVLVQLMYYKFWKVNFIRGGLYIDAPDWMKKKKATINLKNTNDQCFQYATTVALNSEEIKWNPERVLNSINVRVFFETNMKKKHLHNHDKNYCYFFKSNIHVINLTVGSRNIIKLPKNMSL